MLDILLALIAMVRIAVGSYGWRRLTPIVCRRGGSLISMRERAYGSLTIFSGAPPGRRWTGDAVAMYAVLARPAPGRQYILVGNGTARGSDLR